MLVVHATFPIDPDARDEALDHIKTLAEASRAEAGVIDYRVGADIDDPNVFRFLERYEDETDYFQSFEAALPDLLAGDPDVMRFDVESASEVEL